MIPFDFLRPLCLSVFQVERRNLSLIRVGPQTVGSIVNCQFIQCFFYGMFYLSEGWIRFKSCLQHDLPDHASVA